MKPSVSLFWVVAFGNGAYNASARILPGATYEGPSPFQIGDPKCIVNTAESCEALALEKGRPYKLIQGTSETLFRGCYQHPLDRGPDAVTFAFTPGNGPNDESNGKTLPPEQVLDYNYARVFCGETPEEQTPSRIAFDFPKVDTKDFVHGLCVKGAALNGVFAWSSDESVTYTPVPEFKEGTKLWGNADNVVGPIAGAEHCVGGTYLQPSKRKTSNKSINISLEALSFGNDPVTICAFVESNGNQRDGKWNQTLYRQGFSRSTPFDWNAGKTRNQLAKFYCKDIAKTSLSQVPAVVPVQTALSTKAVAPPGTPTGAPSLAPDVSFAPTYQPTWMTVDGTPISYTYVFPSTATTEFVHGLCLLGAAPNGISVTSTDETLEYTPVPNFGEGVKLWDNRDYVSGPINGPAQCEGGTYLRPNKHKVIPQGTVISLEAQRLDTNPVTVCAFVESNGVGRDGDWDMALSNDGFSASENFDWHAANSVDWLGIFYCKQITTGGGEPRPSTPTSAPSLAPDVTFAPTYQPTWMALNGTAIFYTYVFPSTATTEFVHGLCLLGAAPNGISVTSTDETLEYTPVPNFGEGVKLWDNRDYVSGPINGPAQCEGGTYLRPNKHKVIPQGTVISLEAQRLDTNPVTVCAFVESNGVGRDGDWDMALSNDGFSASENFDWHAANSVDWLGIFYCKQITTGGAVPTAAPTAVPTSAPTAGPTPAPTTAPPTAEPTDAPPASAPTGSGTKPPTRSPTDTSDWLDRFQLRPVGDGKTAPYGDVEILDPFVGKVYFEAHPSQFFINASALDVTLWANAPAGETCDRGEFLETTGDYKVHRKRILEFPRYSELYEGAPFPRTKNGVVGVAEFSISDYTAPSGDRKIYFPGKGKLDGQIELCVQVSTKADYTGDGNSKVISFVDTRYRIDVDLTGNFQSFTNQRVDIVSEAATGYEEEVRSNIDVEAFLCGPDNRPLATRASYTDGRDFRICVEPVKPSDSTIEYVVSSFRSVACSNKGEFRELVTEGRPDALTTLDETPDAGGILGFESVVTSGYLSEKETSFSCSGEVSVSHDADAISIARRRRRRSLRSSAVRFRVDHRRDHRRDGRNNRGRNMRREDDDDDDDEPEEDSIAEADASAASEGAAFALGIEIRQLLPLEGEQEESVAASATTRTAFGSATTVATAVSGPMLFLFSAAMALLY